MTIPSPLVHAGPLRAKALTHAARLLVVVEGVHDLSFLFRLSARLHAEDASLPDLGQLEASGRVIFLPSGGGNPALWAQRLAALPQREFHLYDGEAPPLTAERRQVVAAINRRDGCVAHLTTRRSLENYLHPRAVWEALGLRVAFDAQSDLAGLVARQVLATSGPGLETWEALPPRERKRRRERAKRWLNARAVERMTRARLAEQDPAGEVLGWLQTIARMAGPP